MFQKSESFGIDGEKLANRIYPKRLEEIPKNDVPPNVGTPCFFNQKKVAKQSTTSKDHAIIETLGKVDKAIFQFNKNMLEFVFTQLNVPRSLL